MEVDLRYNLLTSSPPHLRRYIFTVKLNSEGNVFSAVPEAVYDMGSIQTLNVAYNQLKELPTRPGKLNFLYEIDFSGIAAPNITNRATTNVIRLVPGALFENYSNRTIRNTLEGNTLQIHSTDDGFGMIHVLRHHASSFILCMF